MLPMVCFRWQPLHLQLAGWQVISRLMLTDAEGVINSGDLELGNSGLPRQKESFPALFSTCLGSTVESCNTCKLDVATVRCGQQERPAWQ